MAKLNKTLIMKVNDREFSTVFLADVSERPYISMIIDYDEYGNDSVEMASYFDKEDEAVKQTFKNLRAEYEVVSRGLYEKQAIHDRTIFS